MSLLPGSRPPRAGVFSLLVPHISTRAAGRNTEEAAPPRNFCLNHLTRQNDTRGLFEPRLCRSFEKRQKGPGPGFFGTRKYFFNEAPHKRDAQFSRLFRIAEVSGVTPSPLPPGTPPRLDSRPPPAIPAANPDLFSPPGTPCRATLVGPKETRQRSARAVSMGIRQTTNGLIPHLLELVVSRLESTQNRTTQNP